jgi:hypothetical protein
MSAAGKNRVRRCDAYKIAGRDVQPLIFIEAHILSNESRRKGKRRRRYRHDYINGLGLGAAGEQYSRQANSGRKQAIRHELPPNIFLF